MCNALDSLADDAAMNRDFQTAEKEKLLRKLKRIVSIVNQEGCECDDCEGPCILCRIRGEAATD